MRLLLHPERAPCIDSVLHVQIISSSTLSHTWSSEASASCTGYRSDVTNVLKPFNVLQNLSFPEQRLDIMHLSGTHVLSQPVTDMLADRTGERGMEPAHWLGTVAFLAFPRVKHHKHRLEFPRATSGYHACA